MHVFCDWSFVAVRAMNRALSSMRSTFGSLGSHYAIWRSLFESCTLGPTMFPTMCSFNGVKELFV